MYLLNQICLKQLYIKSSSILLFFLLGSLILIFALAFLDLFQASDVNICSVLAFQPLRKSSHVVVSVFIDFPSNSKLNTPFRMFTILVLVGMVFLILWEMLHKYAP